MIDNIKKYLDVSEKSDVKAALHFIKPTIFMSWLVIIAVVCADQLIEPAKTKVFIPQILMVFIAGLPLLALTFGAGAVLFPVAIVLHIMQGTSPVWILFATALYIASLLVFVMTVKNRHSPGFILAGYVSPAIMMLDVCWFIAEPLGKIG